MRIRNGRKPLLRILLGSAALAVSIAAANATDLDDSIAFEIPALSLKNALLELSRQASLQIVFSSNSLPDRGAPQVSGKMPIKQALDRLLNGTRVQYKLKDGTLAVGTDLGAAAVPSDADIRNDGTRGAANTRDWGGTFASNNGALLAQTNSRSSSTEDTGSPSASESGVSLEEIVVTGSRLRQSQFSSPTPLTTLTSEDIEQRAPINIADLTKDIPALRSEGGTQSRGNDQSSGVQSLLNLRGLGGTRTLVLLNGHRHVNTNPTGSFDVSLIPVGLVDRVEVVTGGASAAYGSDAVAGVVNYILKDHLQGMNATLQTGQSEHGDNREYVGNVAGGTSFAEGRGHAILGIDFQRSDGAGNIYSRSYGAVEPGLINNGAVGSATRPAGTPAQSFSNGVEYGTATPGGLITSAGALKNVAFDAAGNPYNFGQGRVYATNMTGSTANYGYSTNSAFSLANPLRRVVAYGRAEYELADAFTIYGEYGLGRVKQPSTKLSEFANNGGTASTPAAIIAAGNPYIPASIAATMTAGNIQSFTLGRINTDFGGARVTDRVNTDRYVVGAKGGFGGDWKWDAYYEHGKSVSSLELTGEKAANYLAAIYAVKDASGNIVCGPIASNPNLNGNTPAQALLRSQVQPGCVPFNPFGTGQASAAAYDYITGTQRTRFDEHQDVGSLNITGTPFSDWAGPVSVAAGAEYRREDVASFPDSLTSQYIYTTGNYSKYQGAASDQEIYAEAGVPLVVSKPWIKSLDFNAAVRLTDYKLSGSETTWKFGTTYEPNDSLLFRVTRSHDIRAPALIYLYLIGNTTPTNVTNPFNNGALGQVDVRSQGRTDLKSETAETWTGGFTFRPKWAWASGFSASVDYYDIKIADSLGPVGAQNAINNCYAGSADACSYITFDSTTANGISRVLNYFTNSGTAKTSGLDFTIDYNVPLSSMNMPGRLRFSLLANHAINNSTYNPVTKVTTQLAGSSRGVPEWAGNMTMTYGIGKLDASLQFRGFSSLLYDSTLQGPDDPAYNPNSSTSINKNRFPGFVYTNFSARYQVTPKLQVYGLINNVTDRQPPEYAAGAGSQFAGYYDFIGRSFRLGARLNF